MSNPEIIIIDDDPIVGQLTFDILQEAGFQTQLLQEGRKLLELAKRVRPRAILLDIMMPGIDGLSLCRMIRKETELKDSKIVIISAKAFPLDKERAYQQGADLFIEKPYNIDTLAPKIAAIIGPPHTPTIKTPAPPPTRPPTLQTAQLEIWGCRGIAPLSTGQQSRYGSRTPCISLEIPGSPLIILDAGTGILPLGEMLVKSPAHQRLKILLTHFHLDHIQGLGTFACARDSRCTLEIYGPDDPERDLKEMVREIFTSVLSPMANPPKARLEIHPIAEGTAELGPQIQLHALYTFHPSTTLAFALEFSGKKIIYCPDSEVQIEPGTAFLDYTEKLTRFCENADILIHDAQYTPEDYQKHKQLGHSSWEMALELGLQAKAKKLLLFHHNPAYSDAQLDGLYEACRQKAQAVPGAPQILMAQEGQKIIP
ncbi:MAG: response regulator [Elusimicrobia bacterium]|nr:response regulator [Elusimicrobiota bacterium]